MAMQSRRIPRKLKQKVFGPINRRVGDLLLSLPVLGVFWLLVQHEPVVLLTPECVPDRRRSSASFFIRWCIRRQEAATHVAYIIAAAAIILGHSCGIANLASGCAASKPFADYSAVRVDSLIVGFVVYGFLTHYSDEFGRTVVLMFLILSTVVFWALFEQSAGSMTLFADRVVDRIGGVTRSRPRSSAR